MLKTKHLTMAVSVVVAMAVSACSNSSLQTNEQGIVIAEASGSVVLYSMDDVIDLTVKNADKHCQVKQEKRSGGLFQPFFVRNVTDELKKVKDLLETGKGIFDIFPSHTYRVTGLCK